MKKQILGILLFLLAGTFFYFFINKKITPIQNNDILVIGTNAEYQPFTFIENDTIVGFDIDIAKEIGKRLNKKIIIRDMPFHILTPEIQKKSVDLLAAGITPVTQREKILLFTIPYFTGDPLVIISPKNKPIKSIQELKGKTVIVNQGYSADFYMSENKAVNLIRLPTVATAFLTLDTGRAAAFIAAQGAVDPFFKQYKNNNYTIQTIPNYYEKYALAVHPHNKKLQTDINTVLTTMKNDGTLSSLKKKWNLS